MKLKRVYIKRAGGEIASEACYAAWKGFSAKGYALDFFEWDELTGRHLPLARDTLVVGGAVAVQKALAQLGLPMPAPLNVPAALRAFAGRALGESTLGAFRERVAAGAPPVFVKPLATAKEFAGFVCTGAADLSRVAHLDADLPVQTADPVEFVSEWRYFVVRGEVAGVAHYRGDCFVHPNADMVREAVGAFAGAPAGYGLDFGVTSDGRTLLVEANDGFALGAYGLDPVRYAELLEARWLELAGIA